MTPRHPSIGMFFGRPDRSAHLARRLRERGFEVTTYNRSGVAGEPYVPVAGGFRALLHLLLNTHHDVYFTGLSHARAMGLYLNRAMRRRPYVFNATGVKWEIFRDRSAKRPLPALFENVLHPFVLERTFAGASRIVCNSGFLENKIGERYPQFRPRLTTIYDGIDFERYAAGTRQSLPGVESGDRVLLFVTALNFGNKAKGLELVLDAFEKIRSEERAVKLVVAAKAARQTYLKPVLERLHSTLTRRGVLFYRNDLAVPDLLASADIFLNATPSDSNDSLPAAVLEAQTGGLPVVTTSTTGCPEIVIDGETGFVVPYDATELADAAIELLRDPAKRRNMGARAKRELPRRFNWEEIADAYARVFDEVAA